MDEPVILTTSHETLFVGMAADYAVQTLKKLSERLWQVMPAIVLGQRANLYGWRNNVSGFVKSPSLVTAFWNIEKH